jgi:hypothetical protein
MIIHGTPGRTRIVPVDPNNIRVDIDPDFMPTPAPSPTPTPTPTPTPAPSPNSPIDARFGDYAAGTPTWIPNNGIIGIAIDTSNSRIWWYFNGVWQ